MSLSQSPETDPILDDVPADEPAPEPDEPDEVDEPEGDEPAEPEGDEPAEPEHVDPEKARLGRERRKFRQELKAAQQRLADMQEREQRLMDLITGAQKQREVRDQPAPATEPDKEQDPVAWLEWNFKRSQEAASKFEQWQQQQEAARREQQEFGDLVKWTATAYGEFAQEAPDFPQAYEHVKTVLMKEYGEKPIRDGGRWRQRTEAEVLAQVAAEERAFAAEMRRTGADPAEAIYEYAKLRGYRAAAPARTPVAEGDRRREAAATVRGVTSGAAGSAAPPTQEWVLDNYDSKDPKARARARSFFDKIDQLARGS